MSNKFVTFNPKDFIEYRITGNLYNSKKRFLKIVSDWFTADSTNLWRGSIWGVTKEGKRRLIKRVWN